MTDTNRISPPIYRNHILNSKINIILRYKTKQDYYKMALANSVSLVPFAITLFIFLNY